jgi:hypothetical protein
MTDEPVRQLNEDAQCLFDELNRKGFRLMEDRPAWMLGRVVLVGWRGGFRFDS